MNNDLVFSIIISVYNRPQSIKRCLESCLAQTYDNFEIIVVDDGSTDDTVAVINEFSAQRLKLLRNEINQGMGFSLNKATEYAKGQWIVRIDSDHSLRNTALERFFELSRKIPAEVGILGARYKWDDGKTTPFIIPNHVLNYEGRIKWVEEEGGSDYLSCIRRDIFDEVHWAVRRGSVTALLQYDLAKNTNAMIVDEILANEYTDMPNSFHRAKRIDKLQQRKRNALDQAITYDEILMHHGKALEKNGPRQYKSCYLMSAFNYFLAGKKSLGIERIARFLRLSPFSMYGWVVFITGSLGIRFISWAYLHKKIGWS